MSWQVRNPLPLLSAVERLWLGSGDSVRHAALRLYALSEIKPLDAAFECRTAGGRLVYPKTVQPLHAVISANMLADLADARARGWPARVVFGPKIIKVTRERDPDHPWKPKVAVVTGAPVIALPVGCPCQLVIDGMQLEAAVKSATSGIATEPRRQLGDRARLALKMMRDCIANDDLPAKTTREGWADHLTEKTKRRLTFSPRTIGDAVAEMKRSGDAVAHMRRSR